MTTTVLSAWANVIEQRDAGKAELLARVYDGALPPDRQVEVFSALRDILPCRVVRRGEPRSLAYDDGALRNLLGLKVETAGKVNDFYDYLSLNRVAGVLIAHEGRVVLEHYDLGAGPTTFWPSMSVAKSVSTTLVGMAIKDGLIGSLDDMLEQYLPELKGGAYQGVSVRNLLQMTSGVGWNETYTDPSSDRRRMLALQSAGRPGAILDLMTSLPRVAKPGAVWNYSTGETCVMGYLLRAALGRSLSEYLSEKLWKPLGMEHEAHWWLDAADGTETAGMGLNATLRDFARFGLFVLNGGCIDGKSLLPDGWFAEAGRPRTLSGGDRLDYGYMWWPTSDRDGGFSDGAFSARGIFGQRIYLNPARKTMIVELRARPKPIMEDPVDSNAFAHAVVDVLAK
ncbi:serine hydrolase domain-containing protein [Acetobacter nitrogenifigens]|uniref:serine hydrolase domain-containing protein n=1 Tax=Acetobacter nitrogenifigens TaxID=285268 RepID=UPI000417CA77|nr:serine hydrolase [Acetobacter nitrogenifigens]